jgi:hypothetical protein
MAKKASKEIWLKKRQRRKRESLIENINEMSWYRKLKTENINERK